MESFDIGIHAMIASFLNEEDLGNYTNVFDLNKELFWVLLIRERFPQYYNINIHGYDWKEVYMGLLFYVNFDKYEDTYLEFYSTIDKFSRKYPNIYLAVPHDNNQIKYYYDIIQTEEYRRMFPNIISIPRLVEESKWFFMIDNYPIAAEYLIVNRLIELSEDNIEDIIQIDLTLNIFKAIINHDNISQSQIYVLFSSSIYREKLDIAILAYKEIIKTKTIENFRDVLVEEFSEHMLEIDNLSIETFEFVWSIIHPEYPNGLIEIVGHLSTKNVVLIQHVLDNIPFGIEHNILITELSNFAYGSGYSKTFKLLVDKFRSRLTKEDIDRLINVSTLTYSRDDNRIADILLNKEK